MAEYIQIPKNLSLDVLRNEFGAAAVSYYLSRIDERRLQGRTYLNPLKTVYIWATQDRQTCQGYYSSYKGFSRRRKNRNFGHS